MGMMTRHNNRVRAAEKAVLAKKRVASVSTEEIKEESKVETKPDKFYTKTDINSMKVADLRKLATEQGIEHADDISGAELKSILIEKMGL
jgi:hypothetical protein